MTNSMNHEAGFTIIEVVTALVVTAMFLTFFFQMYLAMESQRLSVSRQALASDVAYSNLRKFTAKPAALSTCTDDMDLLTGVPANKPGVIIGSEADQTPNTYLFQAEPTTATTKLGLTGVQQRVKAFAPNGCANFATSPLKIESTVSYGTKGEKVTHVGYVN